MTTIKWLEQEYGNAPDAETEMDMDKEIQHTFQKWLRQLEGYAPEEVKVENNKVTNMQELAGLFCEEMRNRIIDTTNGEVE